MSGRPMSDSKVQTCVIRSLVVTIALVAMLLTSSAAHAQVLYGSIAGTAQFSDKTGAVVPNLPVTITDQATGAVRAAQSNGDGTYEFLNVLPGTYTLIGRQGWKLWRIHSEEH